MAFVVTAGTDGIHYWADEATPTTPASPDAVDDAYLGAKALFSFGKWLEEHTTVLDAITDAGGGVIPTAEQLGNIHAHVNLSALQTIPTPSAGNTGYFLQAIGAGTYDLAEIPITDFGGGVIPSAAQMSDLHAHTNLAALATIPTPSAGEIGYVLTVAASGTYSVTALPATDPHWKGYHANSAALIAAHPTGVDGDFAITIDSPGPHSVWYWDINAGPAAWVQEVPGGGVTSINFGLGVQSGVIVMDLDDIADGSTHVKMTNAERTAISDNTADILTLQSGSVTSIDFNAGAGAETGVVTVDLDGIGNGSTYVKATQAQLDAISDNALAITGLGTSKLNQSVWDAYAGRTITSAGRNAVITTAEAAAIALLKGTKTLGQVPIATGTGDDDWTWQTPGTGTGTVTSVNSETPDGAGNVVNNAGHIAPTASRLWLTPAQAANITTALNNSATVSSAMARWQNTEPLTIAVGGTTAWDVVDAIRGTLTLSGNTTLAFPSNLNIDAGKIKEPFLQLLVTQVGGFTLTLSTANGFYPSSGVAYVASTAPGAVDVITFTAAPGSTTKLLYTVAPNYSP